MARDEAKVRFVADTTEFNEQIKAANANMSELRSEAKLLDERFLQKPAFAVEQCRVVTDQMATLTREAIFEAIDLIDGGEYADYQHYVCFVARGYG